MVKPIQAYFRTRDDADAAATSLRALGVGKILSEGPVKSRDDGGDPELVVLPFASTASTGMVSGSTASRPGSLLLAGMFGEDRGPGEEAGDSIVSGVVEDALYEQAVRIVEQHGGSMN